MSITTTCLTRSLLVLATGTVLASCGGGGGDAPSAGGGQPAAPAIVLLAENPAGYYFPGGVAVDAAGTVYLGNLATRKVLAVSPAGVVSELAGDSNVAAGTDGAGNRAGFNRVTQLVFDKQRQLLYALDRDNDREGDARLRTVSPGGVVATLPASSVTVPATAGRAAATFALQPSALALGGDGALNFMASYLMRAGGTPSTGSTTHHVTAWQARTGSSDRTLYVQEVLDRRASTAPGDSPLSFTYPADISATGALGFYQQGLALDKAGNAYFSDTARHMIVKVTPGGAASIFAGAPDTEGTADGTGAAARFRSPTQLVIDKADNLYVLDQGNATVRQIMPGGAVRTVVGVAGSSQTRTGALPGGLGSPAGLALDESGRLYITVDKGVLRVTLQN